MFLLDDEFVECGSWGRERDCPLGFHWRTVEFERIHALGVLMHKDKDRNAARNSILTEAVLAHDAGQWVSYSRRKGFYAGLRRYHGTAYTYTTILDVIEELLRLGLINEERSTPGQRGRQSRFRATPRLVEGLAGARVEYELHGLIRLKNADGQLIGFTDTIETRRMRRDLEEMNEFLGAIELRLDAPGVVRTKRHLLVDGGHYRPTIPCLYRVFNRGRFSLGGRAFGWWQHLPKDRRKQILLNGELVAEPDFHQMHASILYAKRGLRLEGDAYVTGEFSRDEGKLAFNIALNAKTLQGAIAALRNKPEWSHSGQETARLIKVLKRRHAPIADDIHTDQGIRLMRLDSEITLDAVKGCMKAGIPVLPVHDSMLTPRRHTSRVAEIMEESAARCLKAPKPCSVRVPAEPVPHMPSLSLVSSHSPSTGRSEKAVCGSRQLDLFPTLAPSVAFSRQIRELRDRLGLSQQALAKRVGCRQPHIANVEGGRARLGEWPRRRLRDLMAEAA